MSERVVKEVGKFKVVITDKHDETGGSMVELRLNGVMIDDHHGGGWTATPILDLCSEAEVLVAYTRHLADLIDGMTAEQYRETGKQWTSLGVATFLRGLTKEEA